MATRTSKNTPLTKNPKTREEIIAQMRFWMKDLQIDPSELGYVTIEPERWNFTNTLGRTLRGNVLTQLVLQHSIYFDSQDTKILHYGDNNYETKAARMLRLVHHGKLNAWKGWRKADDLYGVKSKVRAQ